MFVREKYEEDTPKQFLGNAAEQGKIYPELVEPVETNAAGKNHKKDFCRYCLNFEIK